MFESNAGGGGSGGSAAAHGSGAAAHRGKNPFKREHWNLTEQMKLQKTDPKLAERLRASA